MDKVKVGVIGVGYLGQHHARIYSKMAEVELVGIIDIDEKRALKISKEYKVPVYTSLEELSSKIEAVSIAVPTKLHHKVGKEFLKRRIHTLVEKPITSSLEEAEELLKTAKENNCILQVGHIERFNPAVWEAQKYVNNPRFIESYRLGPFDPRASEVGVVLDLMIHDIDIILFLVNSPVVNIDAVGAAILTSEEDIATVHLNFENGCVANVTASRVTLETMRKIRIFQENAYISLDYAKQSLKIYKKKESLSQVKSMSDIERIKLKLDSKEPLEEELKEFISCIKEKRKPLVSGEHGRNALEVGLEILKKLKGYKQ